MSALMLGLPGEYLTQEPYSASKMLQRCTLVLAKAFVNKLRNDL
jgi:hypothetical protein